MHKSLSHVGTVHPAADVAAKDSRAIGYCLDYIFCMLPFNKR